MVSRASKSKPRDVNDVLREDGEAALRQRFDESFAAPPFDQADGPPILSKRQFVGGFTPPDYLIDGALQKRFFYTLTGQTGHAKTAIALHIAQLVSSCAADAMLGSHAVSKGRVIYMVGENPDDLRMRVIGADSLRTDHPEKDQIVFVPGTFAIPDMQATIAAEARRASRRKRPDGERKGPNG